jgi:hypothetical protein
LLFYYYPLSPPLLDVRLMPRSSIPSHVHPLPVPVMSHVIVMCALLLL